jgi:hypothetical protein
MYEIPHPDKSGFGMTLSVGDKGGRSGDSPAIFFFMINLISANRRFFPSPQKIKCHSEFIHRK